MKEIPRKERMDEVGCGRCEVVECDRKDSGYFYPGCPSDPSMKEMVFEGVMLDYLNTLIAQACDADRQEED